MCPVLVYPGAVVCTGPPTSQAPSRRGLANFGAAVCRTPDEFLVILYPEPVYFEAVVCEGPFTLSISFAGDFVSGSWLFRRRRRQKNKIVISKDLFWHD